jgi:ABC-type proline/glycine betaine transport system ATPase subunit
MGVEPKNRSSLLEERLADAGLTERALALAVSHALEQHRRAGNPVAVWRDGEVVWIDPEDIVLPPEG